MLTRLLDLVFNYECPHCHKHAISTWRTVRFPARPARWIACSECGTQVTTTLWSSLWCILPPCAAVVLLAIFFGPGTLVSWILLSAIFLVSVWVNQKFLVWIER